MNEDIKTRQQEICRKYNTNFQSSDMNLKVGISAGVRQGVLPIHGMRIKEEAGTCGWYIWAGEWSDDPDFFLPLHVKHLPEWSELVLPYLGLPEGWRFLVAPEYEDVWHDPNILKT